MNPIKMCSRSSPNSAPTVVSGRFTGLVAGERESQNGVHGECLV